MTSLATAARDAVRRERKRAGLIVSLFSSVIPPIRSSLPRPVFWGRPS
jgi:hypothetical protein